MSRMCLRYFTVAVGIVLIHCCSVEANPSSSAAHQPMAIIGTVDGAKAEADRLYKLFQEHAKRVIVADRRQSDPQSIPGEYLARMHGEAWKAARDADRLAQMGEPAGEDLRIRFEAVQAETNRLCQIYRRSTKGKQQTQNAIEKLRNQKLELQRFLDLASKAVAAGKLEAFEKQIESKGIKLRESLAYLSSVEQKPYWHPFALVLALGDAELRKSRQAEYATIVQAEIDKNIGLAKSFAAEAERIRREIASSGKATLDQGVQGDAAESFAYLVECWGRASAGLNRAIALNWAFTNRTKIVIEPTPQQLYRDAQPALVSLIDAAASSPQIDDVPRLYSELLKQVATADRRCRKDAKFMDGFKDSFDQFARQDRNLHATVSAYQMATQQPLRWQRKFVSQQVSELSKGFSTMRKLLYSKREASTAKRSLFAPINRQRIIAASNTLVAPASVLVQEATPVLVGARITSGRLIRLSPESRTSVVPVQIQGYISSPSPKPRKAQLDDLRSLLMITDSHGPLTLEAANAITSAEYADYESVGGVVAEIHLESLVTRFATMPDIAHVLVPLGNSAKLTTLTFPRKQVCWRLNINPQWAHNEYLVVQTNPPAN
jgi:hypothetical protein